MSERHDRRAGGYRSVALTLVCLVIAGALAGPAAAKTPGTSGAKRGGKKAPSGQAAPGRKKTGTENTIRLARLNEKTLKELHAKLDTDHDSTVSMAEFKALPAALAKILKAASRGKERRDKSVGGARKGAEKATGRKKKKGTRANR